MDILRFDLCHALWGEVLLHEEAYGRRTTHLLVAPTFLDQLPQVDQHIL